MIRMARPVCGMLALAVALLPACKSRTDAAPPANTPPAVPLYTDLGAHHHPITATPEAQSYFDQGLRLMYAFNHDEAIASFKEGARLDPDCAMCWWGVALALGPNINLPMDPKLDPLAWDAVHKAAALAPKVRPEERDYIAAVSQRYANQPEQRASLDSAYADAMRALKTKYPEDLDAATLYAEALMDLQPWNYWTVGGQPKGAIEEIVGTLEAVLAKDPNNPGACHYYIHAIEASPAPERGLPCADRLAQLMPGAGHIVHMPGHIYLRVGRYDLAAEHSKHGADEDVGFIGRRHPAGLYPLIYTTHNYHFLWAALQMQGRSTEAIEAARELARRAPPEAVRHLPPMEYYSPTPYLALVRFDRWNEVLEEPAPPDDLKFTTGFYHYARGLAFSSTGKPIEAKAEREKLAAIETAMPADQMANLNSMKVLLGIALKHLDAELALRQGHPQAAVKVLREAVAMEDGLTYDEPPPWYHPIRQVLGNVLLSAGRAKEAEAVFREDLKRFRENGWSLHGLALALAKQGKAKEAQAVTSRFKDAWAEADYPL